MPPAWHDAFLAWSQTEQHQAAVQSSRDEIAAMYREYMLPGVAYSGGKDSACCLHLIAQTGSPFEAFFYDFGRPGHKAHNVFPEPIAEEIMAMGRVLGASLLRVVTKRRNWPDEQTAIAGRPPWCTVEFVDDGVFWVLGNVQAMQRHGCGVSVVGLRADEGVRRRHRIRAGNALTELPEAWPVAEWTEMDAWAYIVANDLPYCSVYDERAKVYGGYQGLRMVSMFRDDHCPVNDTAVDGVLNWRHRR